MKESTKTTFKNRPNIKFLLSWNTPDISFWKHTSATKSTKPPNLVNDFINRKEFKPNLVSNFVTVIKMTFNQRYIKLGHGYSEWYDSISIRVIVM